MKCECCGQEVAPKMSMDEYNARAIPRLEAIDRLSKRINFGSMVWQYTREGERWQRLIDEQGADEVAAGL